jgi:hypothetical protein
MSSEQARSRNRGPGFCGPGNQLPGDGCHSTVLLKAGFWAPILDGDGILVFDFHRGIPAVCREHRLARTVPRPRFG